MEPSSKRMLIILGAILVILIIVFVFALAHDSSGGGGPQVSAKGRASWKQRLFGAPEPPGPGQIHGCTSALGTFTMTACVLTISPADTRSRSLVIETTGRAEMVITTDADGRKLKTRSRFNDPEASKPTKSVKVSIGKDGLLIPMRCCLSPRDAGADAGCAPPPNTTCQVTLKKE
jgi:hypothetical protein